MTSSKEVWEHVQTPECVNKHRHDDTLILAAETLMISGCVITMYGYVTSVHLYLDVSYLYPDVSYLAIYLCGI